jgi:catechol 2,3-dioxygenase-like lactoylglutathione lyase family enzyme
MIDHIGITVSDVDKSKQFYSAALSPLGYRLIMEHGISGAGFGREMKPSFWIRAGVVSGTIHLAFASVERSAVGAFYLAAITAGRGCGPNTTQVITASLSST